MLADTVTGVFPLFSRLEIAYIKNIMNYFFLEKYKPNKMEMEETYQIEFR
jgi:hypothetical protein